MSLLHRMSRRRLLAVGASAAAASLSHDLSAGTAGRPVVVELFTSQGCSSCPPADALMRELRSAPGVLAISLHIDYWDYLGWRDTLGDSAYSERQRAYARSRGDGDVYTPQMVIDGQDHFVGSDKQSVRSGIDRARAAMPEFSVPLSLTSNDHEFTITAGGEEAGLKSTLWLMAIAPAIAVTVKRGENAGREIVYYNAVRRLTPVGMWQGKPLSLKLPIDSVLTEDSKACAVLLQSGHVGPVIGAAAWGEINHTA